MKKLLVLLFGFLLPVACWGQVFRVIVYDESGQPFPYVYVHINDRPVAATDLSGAVEISVDRLNAGDVIKATCVGLKPGAAVVSQAMLGEGECAISLSEAEYLEAAEATVYPEAGELFLARTRDYTDIASEGPFEIKADFRIKVIKNGREQFSTAGTLGGGAILDHHIDDSTNILSRIIYFETDPEIPESYETILNSLHSATICSGIAPLQYARTDIMSRYGVVLEGFIRDLDKGRGSRILCHYLGKNKKNMIFRISYAAANDSYLSPRFYSQILLYVDGRKGVPVYVEHEIADMESLLKLNYKLKDFEIMATKRKKMAVFARTVDYRGEVFGGMIDEVSLGNIRYELDEAEQWTLR